MLVKIGKEIELDVDVDRLPAKVMEHVVYMGLRNILMDSHANETEVLVRMKDGEKVTVDNPNWKINSRNIAIKKLDAMYAGEVEVRSERETDPVRKLAITMAVAILAEDFKKRGEKFDNQRTRGAQYLVDHPELTDRAKVVLGL